MKLTFAIFCLLAVTVFAVSNQHAIPVHRFTDQEYAQTFEEWVHKHDKHYSDEELPFRFKIFAEAMEFVAEFNEGDHTYQVGLNKFADLSNTEFLERYTGLRAPMFRHVDPNHQYAAERIQSVPASFDWGTSGVVTPVKDQGQCGSCWSFSTTGSVEGAWARNYSLVSLSEQNLMDCSWSYGNRGCNGGWMDSAFSYIINNGGITTEAAYPYTAKSSLTCSYAGKPVGAKISSYQDIASGSESDLQNAVYFRGPVSVAIDASHNSFQLYTSGVYYESACSSTQLDHGVLVVGYSASNGVDYWNVKNSWGTGWGQAGYIWMSRNRSNNCGIATAASFPVV